MHRNLLRTLVMILPVGGALAVAGCETRPVTEPATPAPVREDADINVDIGNGRGVQIDIDPNRPYPDGKATDVDVDVGGPRGGVKVDVDR